MLSRIHHYLSWQGSGHRKVSVASLLTSSITRTTITNWTLAVTHTVSISIHGLTYISLHAYSNYIAKLTCQRSTGLLRVAGEFPVCWYWSVSVEMTPDCGTGLEDCEMVFLSEQRHGYGNSTLYKQWRYLLV